MNNSSDQTPDRTPSDAFSRLLEMARDNPSPPVDSWQPERTGTIDIRIDHHGDWFHENTRFKRAALVKLFAGILRLDDSEYYLVTPVEKLRIEVEDVPFVAVDFEVSQLETEQQIAVTTNVGDVVVLGAEHPLEMRSGVPYVHIRRGLWARLLRSAFYRLIEVAEEVPDKPGHWIVRSDQQQFSIGEV